jgi:hypothetical protein
VTALKNRAPAFNDNEREFVNVDNATVRYLEDHPTTAPSTLYTNLDTLHHDFHNGIPGAVAYMQISRSTPRNAYTSTRSGKLTSGPKYGITTTSRTQSVTSAPGHDHGMLKDMRRGYLVSSRDRAPYIRH